MACLQNGTTLLNNNNLSSFKHNIMKYDETHANVYTSQINNFLSNQIPFRNNHTNTKEKSQSDNNVFKEEDLEEEQMHSCLNKTSISDDGEEENRTIVNTSKQKTNVNEIVETKDLKTIKPFQFFKTTDHQNDNKTDETIGWLQNSKNTNTSHIYNTDDNSYQKEFPPDKGASEPNLTESGEPSHHARRPMNAFLIFCKRHRTIVKNRYPHLENRAVTKILGEWWAGLDPDDKACYTELAKQYKNAFFSANPNFKWYKLPAPPLRTLNTRPGNIVKSPPPPKEPEELEEQPQQLFTPGKLADETQLGSITSLINSNNQHSSSVTKTPLKNSDDSESINEKQELSPDNYKKYLLSPPNSNIIMCQPPKPFKKRVTQQNKDTKNIVRSIFNNDSEIKPDGNIFDSSLLQQALQSFVIDEAFEGEFKLDFRAIAEQQGLNNNTNSNLTQQELINKVVDHMCSSKSNDTDEHADDCNSCMQNESEESRETRKSVRSCKGLLYAKFMSEGKLFVSKRNRKNIAAATKLAKPCSFAAVSEKVPRFTEPIELSDTIKKLAERTIGSSAKPTTDPIQYNIKIMMDHTDETNPNETQESHDETIKKMFRAADFNLDEKIEALPSLSLDKFQQKKKENKKRKFLRATRIKDTAERKKKVSKTIDNQRSENDDKNAASIIGSRKRKPLGKPRKKSERAIDNKKQNINNNNNDSSSEIDLFGLATLAEVAAKKAKIDQK